jgi:hypothetical protein
MPITQAPSVLSAGDSSANENFLVEEQIGEEADHGQAARARRPC